ncbi:MAG: MT-A70 family methyltransferase [Rhodospirillaceae bacterium]|nr:MT-A70 family methyltransferase [Rhodospirillaceae bacterium]
MGPYTVIYADPPWRFEVWSGETAVKARKSGTGTNVAAGHHYNTMTFADIKALPVRDWAADDAALFIWICWPMLPESLDVIAAWGFDYKTCAFSWMKARVNQIDMFRDDADAAVGMGYWTRANSEVCLLATRGAPKRISAGVRQGIIEPRREHSRKPDCVPERIVALMGDVPRLEMFARTRRPGWDAWGNQTDKFAARGEQPEPTPELEPAPCP